MPYRVVRLSSALRGPPPNLNSLTGVIVSFPLDTEIDLLRSVHSLTPGTNFLRTSASGGGGGGGGAVTPTGYNTPITGPGPITLLPYISMILFPANIARAYYRVINYGSDVAYIQEFITASIGAGTPVYPNQVLTISGFELTYAQISAISASSVQLDLLEAGY